MAKRALSAAIVALLFLLAAYWRAGPSLPPRETEETSAVPEPVATETVPPGDVSLPDEPVPTVEIPPAPRRATLICKVRDTNGRPIPDAKAMLVPPTGDLQVRHTDDRGESLFEELRAGGEYELGATAPGYELRRVRLDLQKGDNEQQIELGIDGRILFAVDDSIPYDVQLWDIELLEKGGSARYSRSMFVLESQGGRYTLSGLSPGNKKLRLSHYDAGGVYSTLTATVADLRRGETRDLGLLRLENGEVTFLVSDENGSRVGGGLLRGGYLAGGKPELANLLSSLPGTLVVPDDGRVTVRGLTGGRTFVFDGPRGSRLRRKELSVDLSGRQTVEVILSSSVVTTLQALLPDDEDLRCTWSFVGELGQVVRQRLASVTEPVTVPVSDEPVLVYVIAPEGNLFGSTGWLTLDDPRTTQGVRMQRGRVVTGRLTGRRDPGHFVGAFDVLTSRRRSHPIALTEVIPAPDGSFELRGVPTSEIHVASFDHEGDFLVLSELKPGCADIELGVIEVSERRD